MHRSTAPSYPAHVHPHVASAHAMATFGAASNWSAAFAATATERTAKRTARHLGTETT